MSQLKKNILVFGANSFIAKTFLATYDSSYVLYPVYRNKKKKEELALDFTDSSQIEGFNATIDFKIDAILFLQGINPSQGAKDISEEHFLKMLKVNLINPTLLLAKLFPKMNKDCLVLFISSVAKRKGSYDPSYAAAKSGMTGLLYSLAKAYPDCRFNMISLGLVEGSPVFNQMTDDFKAKHASHMQNGQFIKAENVVSTIDMLINNTNINTTDIAIDGGYI